MINIELLNKKYGRKKVLKDLSLKINKGEVIGILGPNGSGKSTLIKSIAGLVKTSSGEISIYGHIPSINTKAFTSYLSELSALPKGHWVKDIIYFYNLFYDDFDRKKCLMWLEKFKLNNEMGTKTNKLSKGMLQKLRVALTLSRNAKVYLLDEPFNGVDPLSREEILDSLIESIDEQSIIIITTHIVSEIEQILTRAVFINNGKIIGDFDSETIRCEDGFSVNKKYKEVFRNA